MSFEKLQQIFSAVLLTCAVFFLTASKLLSTSYLLELNGPLTLCFATFGFVLVHWGFVTAAWRGFETQTWGALGVLVCTASAPDWGIGLSACCSRMCVTEREDEMELSSLVKQFPGELVTFFFKKFILIEVKENFTPWGYYWEVLLNFTQFSAISFAAFQMMNPRPACGVTDWHNALLQCDFCMNCMVSKKEAKCNLWMIWLIWSTLYRHASEMGNASRRTAIWPVWGHDSHCEAVTFFSPCCRQYIYCCQRCQIFHL